LYAKETAMLVNAPQFSPLIHSMPTNLPIEAVIRIELQEGVPMMKASAELQRRIEQLLSKQQTANLTPRECDEIERYEELDDYLSFVNRLVRNQVLMAQSDNS
jgi:hypothetical protein